MQGDAGMTMFRRNFVSFVVLLTVGLLVMQCKDEKDDTKGRDSDTGSAANDSATASNSTQDSDTNDGNSSDSMPADSATVDEMPTENEGTESGTGSTQLQVALMLDDFEDGDNLSLLGGDWYWYTDENNSGASTVTVAENEDAEMLMVGAGYESTAALSLSWALDQGDYEWDPYVGWGVNCGDETTPFDISAYTGITYMFKGDAHTLIIETTNIIDSDFYKAAVDASAEWRRVDISYAVLAQEGWGAAADFVPENVKAISFQAKGTSGDTGSLTIDDLGLLGEQGI
jgi:endoglucanase